MTKRTETTLNRDGTGRGKKVVTRTVTQTRNPHEPRGAAMRGKPNLANMPVAEIEQLDDSEKILTDKAKLFVKFWAQGHSVVTASTMAGYGDGASYAYRLVHLPSVKAMYAEEKRLYEEAAQMTRQKVMDMQVEAYEMAKLMAEPATMVAAAREIGKMCGYYEPVKVSVKLSGSVAVQQQKMERLSNEELLKLIAEGGAQAIADAVQQLEAPDGGVDDDDQGQ